MDKTKFWSRKYEGNIDRLVAICYRYVGEQETAEDLAHEAFLKAIERADTCRVMDSFDAWLTRITVNRCISYLRTRPETVPLEEELTTDPTDQEDEPNWQTGFTKEELLETIQQLSERQRMVFNLHAIDRVSHQQIADLMDISVTNSKQLFLRARTRLQQLLAAKAQEKESKKKGLLMIALLFMMKRNSAHHLDRRPPPRPDLSFRAVAAANVARTPAVGIGNPLRRRRLARQCGNNPCHPQDRRRDCCRNRHRGRNLRVADGTEHTERKCVVPCRDVSLKRLYNQRNQNKPRLRIPRLRKTSPLP